MHLKDLYQMKKQQNFEYCYWISFVVNTLYFLRYTREIAIGAACHYGSQSCLGNATELHQLWMKDPIANRCKATE